MTTNANVEKLGDLRTQAQEEVCDLRSQIAQLDQKSLDLILTKARSHYAWKDRPVTDDQIHRMYEIVKMGSTSMNSCPARFVWVRSEAGKERLVKSLKPKNVPKVLAAPVTVIVAYDLEFWKELPKLFPHEDRRHLFAGNPEYTLDTAYRNSTLQGGYLMIAARAIGLDVGAMSGFSNKIVDEEFFEGTTLRSNFLVNIGHADESALFQRLPRFEFDDVCSFA
ncbi:MAG: putative NADH dehydrogenase/NAD(P)H nitroreductase [Rhizobiaceae bacterium MnEN-MB40S]|nr:MAG: putative NADH dehydrogenase/NAD(P)H nitroreductase [Rhizobiaceae bacterium MnEN-MB40S]